jgi:hypothetical protein
MTRLVRLSTLVFGLAACGGTSIGGSVADDRVGGARDVVFDEVEVEVPVLGTFTFMAILASDIPDACVVLDEFYDNVADDCEEACEDLGRLADEQLGADEYWLLSMGLVANPDRVVGEYAWNAESWTAENEFTSDLTRLNIAGIYDFDACVQDCEDDDTVIDDDQFESTGGTLTLDDYVQNDTLNGSFDVQFADGDLIEGKFRGRHCPEISDWFGF